MDFAERFTLVVLLAGDPFPARVLRQRFLAHVRERALRARVQVCDAVDAPGAALAELLDPAHRDPEAIVWFEATAPGEHDPAWWHELALRLNERREVMRQGAMRVLVLVMPAAAKVAFRQAAVDVWSIVQEALPVAAEPAPPGAFEAQGVEAATDGRLGRGVVADGEPALRVLVEGGGDPAQRAAALVELSDRLSDAGRRSEAVEVIEEAVAVYRGLAASRPEAFEPDLARSLNNLSVRLSAVGQREAARGAIEEAVAVYRRLAVSRPAAFEPDLAGSLNNLSNRLSEVGQREAALGAIEEAVAVHRRLAASRPGAFEPALAGSLNNLSVRLSEVGQREAALGASEEAVAVYRRLAGSRPEAFEPDLAMSLNNLSATLSAVGQRAAALGASEEALAGLRPHFLRTPRAFAPRMQIMLRQYFARLDGSAPDEALLGPIVATLESLFPPDPEPAGD